MKSALFVVMLAVGCGGSGGVPDPVPDPVPDAPIVNPPGGLPTWQLEDVNPQSARVGQTYGVDTFAGKIIVVTLLEGF